MVNYWTYADLPYADDEDKAVNEGKLFLTYDGEAYKIARVLIPLPLIPIEKVRIFQRLR